jgi:hypothetical protein
MEKTELRERITRERNIVQESLALMDELNVDEIDIFKLLRSIPTAVIGKKEGKRIRISEALAKSDKFTRVSKTRWRRVKDGTLRFSIKAEFEVG